MRARMAIQVKDRLLGKASELILANVMVEWTRIVAFVDAGAAGSEISVVVYDDRGHARPEVCCDPDPRAILDELRAVMTNGEGPWLACVIQLDADGEDVQLHAEFEYRDARRWKRGRVIEAFRPH